MFKVTDKNNSLNFSKFNIKKQKQSQPRPSTHYLLKVNSKNNGKKK